MQPLNFFKGSRHFVGRQTSLLLTLIAHFDSGIGAIGGEGSAKMQSAWERYRCAPSKADNHNENLKAKFPRVTSHSDAYFLDTTVAACRNLTFANASALVGTFLAAAPQRIASSSIYMFHVLLLLLLWKFKIKPKTTARTLWNWVKLQQYVQSHHGGLQHHGVQGQHGGPHVPLNLGQQTSSALGQYWPKYL